MARKHKLKPEVREVVEWAERFGWTLQEEQDGGGHWILLHTSGQDVHLPATPRAGSRTLLNAKARIRRISGIEDRGSAGRYRHESQRWSKFDMRTAAREAKARAAERERREAERAAWQAEVDAVQSELNHELDELVATNPRRHPLKVRQIATRVVALEQRLDELNSTE